MRDEVRADALLASLEQEHRGKLKVFLGAAPGVGKTYAMLQAVREQAKEGVDILIGVVETHGRQETLALLDKLAIQPRKLHLHRQQRLEEMDLDGLLARKPAIAVVDELAHSNAEGSRHAKRWQDVEELLDAGIDVLSTINVQHVESLRDVVAGFTRVRVRETVPDHVLEGAEIELVDLPPDELIERLKDGKVYIPAEASRALNHFFSKENLSALREMALRAVALTVDRGLIEHLDAHALAGTYAGGERILVAVSELPGNDEIVRAGKRLADALRAPWQAVHIETPRSAGFDAGQRRAVAEALRLAATLGATIATVPAESVLDGLRTHMAGMRATQLVLGRSVRSWWFELLHGSVVEVLLRESKGLAVHVIPSAFDGARPRPRPPAAGSWRGHGFALALVAVTTMLALAVQPWIGVGPVDLIYLLPVIVAAARFGRAPGIAAGILGGLAYNFFFLPPIHTFTIADPQSVLTVAVLLALAIFVASLADRLRTRASIGSRSAQENAAVAAFGQALARSSDWKTTSEIVSAELSRMLDLSVIVFVDRDGQLTPIAAAPADASSLGPVDQAAADWAWTRGEVSGRDTGTLAAADWQFHPLVTSLGILAVVALADADGRAPVPADKVMLLSTLLGQAALAHERLLLEDRLRDISVLQERDRLRGALLSSIGHDLRTPLTAVTGAIDAIRTRDPDDPALASARAEVTRLRRFLDNLLEMVRIDSGALAVALEPIDLTDAVASAVHDLRDLIDGGAVDLQVPPDLPLVQADPTLLHHILLNLLANAATHGGGRIMIEGRNTGSAVTLSIVDNGPGLPEQDPQRIFDAFVRGTGNDRRGGSGLGLAIVRGFADAMGLTLSAANVEAGQGARLTIGFPIR